jgi:hypothetical protein
MLLISLVSLLILWKVLFPTQSLKDLQALGSGVSALIGGQ